MGSVLVVEDEAICAAFIENLLISKGYDAIIAPDAAIAYQLLESDHHRFQAILLDRNLPDFDGVDLLRKIKAIPKMSQIPVIMETSDDHTDSIREGMEAGAYYYLIKPIHAELLISILTAAISQYRESQELQSAVRQVEESLYLLDQAVFFLKTLEQARNLAKTLAQACPDPGKVVVGLQELLINAVEHGNLSISYADKTRLMLDSKWQEEVQRRQSLPEYFSRRVRITFQRGTDFIRIIIQDQGNGFDWRQFLELDPERAFDPHGRGIALAKMISFDSLEYQGNGNTVELGIKCP
jgi:DNA-binding response OmpR family regulator